MLARGQRGIEPALECRAADRCMSHAGSGLEHHAPRCAVWPSIWQGHDWGKVNSFAMCHDSGPHLTGNWLGYDGMHAIAWRLWYGSGLLAGGLPFCVHGPLQSAAPLHRLSQRCRGE